MAGQTRQSIDLRGLEPPEPLLRILDALDATAPEGLAFVLRHEPYPLYPMLTRAGWHYAVRHLADGVEIEVFRPR